MAVSILFVVPTLDSYRTLPRLITSLQGQTWPHWRLIFIDGPSGTDHRHWLEQCCGVESRCRWLQQDFLEIGIFGAMNQGFALASPDDWVIFWGSDDWAPTPTVLADIVAAIEASSPWPDLLVCRGRYVDADSGALSRPTAFHPEGMLTSITYRRALLLGATPPHQATLIGPSARRQCSRYTIGFKISADLDYFLQLSRSPVLRVQCLDLEFVYMDDGGVSGQQTQRRLLEVCRAYRQAFGVGWWFPFVARYIRRLASLLGRR